MTIGPLRRGVAFLGLLGLAPTGLHLVRGSIEPIDAAIRALVVLAAVMIVGRVISAVVRGAIATVERSADERQDAPSGSSERPAPRDTAPRPSEAQDTPNQAEVRETVGAASR